MRWYFLFLVPGQKGSVGKNFPFIGSNASATSTLTPGSSSGVSSMSGAPLPSPASSSLTPSGSFSSGVESAAQGIQQQQQQQPAGLSAATRDEMLSLAQEIQVDVSGLMRSYTCDRDRLRSALEAVEYQQQMSKTGTLGGSSGPGSNVALIASLRQSLNQAMQQNSMLRARLQKIHLDSDLGDLPMVRQLRDGREFEFVDFFFLVQLTCTPVSEI